MPRNGSGVFSAPAGTTATASTAIESAKYNAFVADLVADANLARPIVAGGTGGTTAATGMANLVAGGVPVGSASAPGVPFATDLTTGLSRLVSSAVSFILGAAEYARFTVTGLRLGDQFGAVPAGTAGQVQVDAIGSAGAVLKRSSADATGPILYLSKSRAATAPSYTILQAADSVGDVRWHGSEGTTSVLSARMSALVEGTPAVGDVRAGLNFYTGSGAGTVGRALLMNSSQAVLATDATGGLGYGAGAGGAVTQATSRTTGVTLNKIAGQITMFTAAGSATWSSFTLTNSTVTATDVVVASQAGGTNNYMFETKVAAGSVVISFATTGGTASDAPIVNFAVIRSVAT